MTTVTRLYAPVYLFVNGVLFAAVAWLFGADATTWLERLQFGVVEGAARLELQTVYVGLMGGLGLFFVIAALDERFYMTGTLLAVFSMLGLVAVRGWGILTGQAFNDLILQLLIVESIDLVAGCLALYTLYRIAARKRNPYF